MNNKKSIFEKIKGFFRKIWRKNNLLLIAPEAGMKSELDIRTEEKIHKNQIILDKGKKENSEITEKYIEEKKRIFEIYKGIKNGKITLDDLIMSDLIKVASIMKEENAEYYKKIEEKKNEVKQLDLKIISLSSKMKNNVI